MLALVAANVVGALVLAWQGPDWALAWQVCAVAGALAGGAVLRWRGVLASRLAVTFALGLLVVLQIHLVRGQLEAHFNVFVTMGLLLAWRDWRPVALLTGLFAIHHLAFDRMLAAGLGTYCLSQPDLLRTAVHLAFAVVMGVSLSRVAWSQGREADEARELEFLVNAMGRDGPIRLKLDVVRVSTQAAQRLHHVQQRMAEAIGLVREAALSVRLAAEHSATGSAELMTRTQTTASGLRDAAMCLEQISVIVQNSDGAASEAKGLSQQATTMADEGGKMVADVVSSMQAIQGSSRRIGDIVGVIDGIAFQTNILALNAAVEAARAGEQGRGFAVVASEVRSLAQRSAAAAREIKDLVATSASTVERGATLVAGTGERMNGLVETVRHVGGLFDTITADANEHHQGLKTVTESVDSLGRMTEENTTLAERTGLTAQVLQDQVQQLEEVLQAFNIGAVATDGAAHADLVRRLSQPVAKAAPAARPQAGSGPAQVVEFF